ncbi:transporter substrate-binding domain-containing protein [Rhodoferax sp.]|uniref:ATP-binding protein n=1 Tax=Rhodoferax sp. TaxID=50421 RepID=UPI0026318EC6|nr:transporter substrate-binding domain-containing protein [Rhodoferax sp.]
MAGLLCVLQFQACAQSLDASERAFLIAHPQVTLCVDPDWWPFEVITESGRHAGIAADLLALVSQRVGLTLKLHATGSWEESLAASKLGLCQLVSFLNSTPEREKWLIFTEPLLKDPNILITREDQPFITDLGWLQGKTIALPRASAVMEHIQKDFPRLKVIATDTEEQALGLVSDKKADMTLRSLIVAAHTIKHKGWFNLKVNGQVPGYDNLLRVGVLKSETVLRDILNKGIATLTTQERNKIIDSHLEIKMVTDVQTDYTLAKWLAVLLLTILATSLVWLHRLRDVNARLRSALAEMKTTEAEQRHFISMLAHEVRSPVAVIDATAQLLAVKLSDENAAHPLVARIRRGTLRLSNFFDNCLTQDRVASKNFALQKDDIDVAELAAWAMDNAELMSDQHAFYLALAPNLPSLRGDQTLLRILLTNLLSNAVKYSPAGTRIDLNFEAYQGHCRIQIANQGLGIPADELFVIFSKYRRGRAAERTPGAGLGLYVVMRIVTLHGGTVWAESQAGDGTRFIIDLPCGVALKRK